MDAIRVKFEFANPIPQSAMERTQKAAVRGRRLSYLETSHPETGRPIIELIGMNKRMAPSSASLNPKAVLMVGILEAQLEKQNPEKKKNAPKNIRCLFFNSIITPIAREYARINAN
jgi:hypothetical protein